jgi:hypothetical protein
MAFHLQQSFYGYNAGIQRQAVGAGGPSSGMTPAGLTPWPRHTPFFGVLQGMPYGAAQSNASPTPWNNRYAKPITFRLFGGVQKAPTYTGVSF